MNNFIKFLSTKENSWALLLVRLSLWIVIFAHWAQKLFWWYWGPWFVGAMDMFTEMMWLSFIVAILIILWESLWAIALMLWFFTRFMAFWIFVIMAWAAYMVHWQNWFFIDWMWNWGWAWIEMHLLTLWMALALMIEWGWKCSVDTYIKNFLK